MKNATGTATSTKRIELFRRSPQYWQVIPQLNEIVNETE